MGYGDRTCCNYDRSASGDYLNSVSLFKQVVVDLLSCDHVANSPFSVNHFLKTVEFTVQTDFEFTDVDGYKQYGNIYGDYREDEDAKEPYLKCFLSGGVAVDFVESRIAEIRKLED